VLTLRSSHLFTGHCLGTSRVTWLMIAGSSPTPEPDDCAQLTPEHWPSVALIRVLSATEHLLPRHHGCGTVCHLSCDNPNCHMDNLGARLRHFYLGSRVTGAVWPLLTAPYKNTYLLTYLLTRQKTIAVWSSVLCLKDLVRACVVRYPVYNSDLSKWHEFYLLFMLAVR